MTLNMNDLIRLGAVRRLEQMRAEVDALIAVLESLDTPKAKRKTGSKKHWTQTPAGRRRVAAIVKASWAKKRRAK